jgi:hypothetical protein
MHGKMNIFFHKKFTKRKKERKKGSKIIIIINDQVCEQYTNAYKLGAN